jgi:hypothetical protein
MANVSFLLFLFFLVLSEAAFGLTVFVAYLVYSVVGVFLGPIFNYLLCF